MEARFARAAWSWKLVGFEVVNLHLDALTKFCLRMHHIRAKFKKRTAERVIGPQPTDIVADALPDRYLNAVETRLHEVEALLGILVSLPDSRATSLLSELSQDAFARDILSRVNHSPFGPIGRQHEEDTTLPTASASSQAKKQGKPPWTNCVVLIAEMQSLRCRSLCPWTHECMAGSNHFSIYVIRSGQRIIYTVWKRRNAIGCTSIRRPHVPKSKPLPFNDA